MPPRTKKRTSRIDQTCNKKKDHLEVARIKKPAIARPKVDNADSDSDMNDDYISPVEESKEEVGFKKKSSADDDHYGGSRMNEKKKRRRQEENIGRKKKSTRASKKSESDDESLAESSYDKDDVEYPIIENPEFYGDNEPLELKLNEKKDMEEFPDATQLKVPASIARYLARHQIEGVQFLYRQWATNRGGILAHDMGLGKTLQIVTIVAALLGLSGMKGKDKDRLKKKKEAYHKAKQDYDKKRLNNQQTDLIQGYKKYNGDYESILIFCPKPTISQWLREFTKYSICKVEIIQATTEQEHREEILDKLRHGGIDVLIVSLELGLSKSIDWSLGPSAYKLIVIDEFHKLKTETTQMNKVAHAEIKTRSPFLVGLTGTPLQNDLEEFFPLLKLCTNTNIGEAKEFKEHFVIPMRQGRAKHATRESRALAMSRQEELQAFMADYMHRRVKEEELNDRLLGKDEVIVKCKLSDLQKEMYKRITAQPDVDIINDLNKRCTCARGKKHGKKRSECCYRPVDILSPLPNKEKFFFASTVHQGAGLCNKKCPSCYYFSIQETLAKIADHPLLFLQIKKGEHPDKIKIANMTALGKIAFGEEEFSKRGGLYHSDKLDKMARVEDSGKMKYLSKLLVSLRNEENEDGKPNKVLIFSHRVQILDIIEALMQVQGYNYVRFDGSTRQEERKNIIKKFTNEENIFIALVSAGAGGTGLNLQAANIVIQYDMNWNPASDQQSQDRACRIGQTRKVRIYRLLSIGTIEELKWMRQIYKRKMTAAGFTTSEEFDVNGLRFEGVKDEVKGELFGMENMIKFSETSRLDELQRENKVSQNIPPETNPTENIFVEVNSIEDLIAQEIEKEIEEIGDRADDYISKRYDDNDEDVMHDDSEPLPNDAPQQPPINTGPIATPVTTTATSTTTIKPLPTKNSAILAPPAAQRRITNPKEELAGVSDDDDDDVSF
uniref:Helicase n=1 Tax=Aureoumbra lagunensis TaxID=44058 RepID=A0A7S3NMI7_9STRA|mmetsp:Transcript_3015/g.4700  ORF Transcript_3015/g.4700 Transcript_3015/m.4700 type:complete len:952 (+) Transcript_3015:871-3726(+)